MARCLVKAQGLVTLLYNSELLQQNKDVQYGHTRARKITTEHLNRLKHSEDGGSIILRNFDILTHHYTV
jgi:hypothetical protein